MGSDEKRSKLDQWCIHVTVRNSNGTYLDFIPLRRVFQEAFADPEMRKLIGTAIAEAPFPVEEAHDHEWIGE